MAGEVMLSVGIGFFLWDINLAVDILIFGSLILGLVYMLVDHYLYSRLQPEREKYSSYQLRLLGNIPQRLDDKPPIRVEICPLFKRHGSK
jgi:hypothetical protein